MTTVGRVSGWVTEVTERLTVEFAGRLSPPLVSDVVRAADQDLTGVPAGARCELLERLARQRLLDALPS